MINFISSTLLEFYTSLQIVQVRQYKAYKTHNTKSFASEQKHRIGHLYKLKLI